MTDTNQQSEDPAQKRVFTTGEAAEICKVSQQTIIRCFDSGRLQGFRVPGSKFRRIPREDLIKFMKANNIPLSAIESGGKRRVLVVDDSPEMIAMFETVLARDPRFEVRSASNGYDAGMLTESLRPHLIILDYMLPDLNGTVICRRIRENPRFEQTRILCVSGVAKQEEIKAIIAAGADAFLPKPFDHAQLTSIIAQLLHMQSPAE